MRARLLGEASCGPLASAARLPGIGWLINTTEPALRVLDEQLVEIARFPLPSTWRATHWVSPDLRFAALSERDRVTCIDRSGCAVWSTPHAPWGGESERGSCVVGADGRLVWATVPVEGEPDAWWVLDAADGRVLGQRTLACRAAGSEHLIHPNGRHVGLSVGEGQDGSEVYWGHWDNGPVVSRLDARDRVLVDVRPDGSQFLATPHDGYLLTTHAFPDGEIAASAASDDVLAEDEWFDFGAGYVNDRLVIAGVLESGRHLLLAADTLAVVEFVDYPEGWDRFERSISASGRGTWLTGEYTTGRFALWRLP